LVIVFDIVRCPCVKEATMKDSAQYTIQTYLIVTSSESFDVEHGR